MLGTPVRTYVAVGVASAAATTLVHHLLRRRAESGLTITDRVSKVLLAYLKPESLADRKVVRLANRVELEHVFAAEGCGLALRKGDAPVDDATLATACQLALDWSVCAGSPKFFNQLYGRPEPVSVAGDWVCAAINANVHTFEVAPVLTVMEHHVLDRLARAIGPAFEAEHDGLFIPGASLGNMYALHLARHRAYPKANELGMNGGPQLAAFVSQESHYSYLKSCRLLGLGSANLIAVGVTANGGIDPAALRAAIASARAAGKTPFFVGATSGSTVRGAFDPLRELAAVCKEASNGTPLWMHIDGAWGGAALLSPTHRGDMDGADEADSLSWSAHKLLGAALQTALFITKHDGALKAANGTNAAYLFQPDKLNTELDAGDKTIQCGRRGDMLKLWLLMKSLGDEGLAQRVDHAYALAAHLVKRIETSNGKFVLAHPPSCTNVCFWYVPQAMRPLLADGAAPSSITPSHAVHGVAPRIKAELQRTGDAMIGFQAVSGLPNFFRWVFASPYNVSTETVDEVLASMERIGDGSN